MEQQVKSLWQILWEYDPNGLVVMDRAMDVRLVNPAFCAMFGADAETLIGKPIADLLGTIEDFQTVAETQQAMNRKDFLYPQYDLCVCKVIFPVKDEDLVACIMVDQTESWKQRQEFFQIQAEAVRKVNAVVDKQMKVAQQIASLLGESTAETKVNLLKLQAMFEKELD
ncbi:MAG: PAS domain-containing protein [Anaerolineaceae bacterium]|nr:PAS domain-containing protein [Anaerolineaceae bacterium]